MKLTLFLIFFSIFKVQAFIIEARTVIFEARDTIWTIFAIIVILIKKGLVVTPPGDPKITLFAVS